MDGGGRGGVNDIEGCNRRARAWCGRVASWRLISLSLAAVRCTAFPPPTQPQPFPSPAGGGREGQWKGCGYSHPGGAIGGVVNNYADKAAGRLAGPWSDF